MNCLVTAGPTFEPLDQVRRLTNFSTGRLGTELANFLTAQGHHVTLLLGEQATWAGESRAVRTQRFTTTADLRERLQRFAGQVEAVFHAAAVSDFSFGRIWTRGASAHGPGTAGHSPEVLSQSVGKIATRDGALLVELVPTPKILPALREWFPAAVLVGWKYEVDGNRQNAIAAALRQLAGSQTNACVLNGPAWGEGYALVTPAEPPAVRPLPDMPVLLRALTDLLPR